MKNVWMYLHCDLWKGTTSMNPCVDDQCYNGSLGRKALWRTIKEDLETKAIKIAKEDREKVKDFILKGNPEEANHYIDYAYILGLTKAV